VFLTMTVIYLSTRGTGSSDIW